VPGAVAGEVPSAAGLERSSFADFYARNYRAVLKVALAMTGSPAVAEDLAQEAFARAYRRWDEVAGYERPDAWVRAVAANLARSMFRRRASEAKAMARLALRRPPEADPIPAEAAAFWTAVRALPGALPQVVALRYVADLSVLEIAQTLGRPENTVKSDLRRARKRLARTLRTAEAAE
jgi:RNA polymerase sigma-70 factor, ECF subfamily